MSFPDGVTQITISTGRWTKSVKKLVRQAFIVSASRFANQGLTMIGPVILVRLLPVAEFGLYRVFLMYSGILSGFAAMSFGNSLLYFLGIEPRAQWGYVRRVVIATAITTFISIAIFGAIELIMGGRLLGPLFPPLIFYVIFVCNIDFWEYLWLAQHKAERALAYTAGRLLLRTATTVVAAAISADVSTIIWSLVVMEGLRFCVCIVYWRRESKRDAGEPVKGSWSDQLGYSVPAGLAVAIWTLVSYLGGVFVSQMIGGAAMAFLSVGGYVLLIVPPLRNAVADVLLPELAGRAQSVDGKWLELWTKATVLFAVLLVPLGAILWRFAPTIVTFAFSHQYAPAVPVFQIFCVTLILGWLDISLALRAVNKTRYILSCVTLSIFVNLGFLWFLVPRFGVAGAAAAQVVTETFTIVYLLICVARVVRLPPLRLIPVVTVGKIALATCLAMLPVFPDFWSVNLGLPGVVAAGIVFAVAYLLALRILGVEEAHILVNVVRSRLKLARQPRG